MLAGYGTGRRHGAGKDPDTFTAVGVILDFDRLHASARAVSLF